MTEECLVVEKEKCMDINDYRLYEFISLVLPLMISLCITLAAYGTMERKYIEIKAYYEPEFKNSKKYRRYAAINGMMEKLMRPLCFEDVKLQRDEE